MSSPGPHARHPWLALGRARFAPFLGTAVSLASGLLATALTAGCGDNAALTAADSDGYDDNFGGEAPRFPNDGGLDLDASTPSDLDGGSEVIVRFVHSLVNVGPLYVCHDPDLVLDDPLTAALEENAGPVDPTVLPLETAFGATGAVALPALSSGILSVHVRPASTSADGGVLAAPTPDAGAAADAGSPELAECSAATRVAALALSAPPDRDAPLGDAGTESAKTSLTSGPLLLIASGVALDQGQLAARFTAAYNDYLGKHPGDEAGAKQAGRAAEAAIQSARGPKLTIEDDADTSVPADSFRLSLSQLTPDVTGLATDTGAVRICVTAGTLQNSVEPSPKESAIAFRDTVPLMPVQPYKTREAYRFRVFPANKFDASMTPGASGSANTSGQDCATTGLTPLAELVVANDAFKGGKAYNLLLMGAVAPSSLCAPVDENSFVRAGCPANPDKLGTRLLLLE